MVILEHEGAAKRDKQKQLNEEPSVDRGAAENVERDIVSGDQEEYLSGQGHLRPAGAALGVNEHAALTQPLWQSGDSGHPPPLYDNIPTLSDDQQLAQALQQSRSDGTYVNYPTSTPSNQDRGSQPSGSSYPGGATEPTVTTVPHPFTIGSMVQLPSDPSCYGVIRWMGTLPDIHGQIAGVELVSCKWLE